MSRSDFDPEELEFRRDIGAPPGRGAGVCPRPELLMAARSGVAFEGSQDVLRHLEECRICEPLSRDLAAHEFPSASEAEDRRIRAKWQAAALQPLRFRVAKPLSLVAAAALVVAGFFVARAWRRPAPPAQTVQGTVPSSPRAAFLLTKAAIKVPAAAVLTYRGNADAAKTYLAELAAALEPYRKDDYDEAARRLALLSRKYPDAAEPAYYLGVSQLFLRQNPAAVESLQTARSHSDETLRDDISWYLALALDRVGRTSEARSQAEALCARAGEYKDQACAALNTPDRK
ncbi:MAG TPA: hypothetical protein VMB25_15910 [Bryobacteraceae bacterium]|nr:hypothetical protein [Bryobacteraceae bacterium]